MTTECGGTTLEEVCGGHTTEYFSTHTHILTYSHTHTRTHTRTPLVLRGHHDSDKMSDETGAVDRVTSPLQTP